MMELVDMRDLGSRAMRWGSSPHARTKKRVIRTDGPLFGTSERTRKGGGRAADAKNMPVACFLARGRVPGFLGAPRRGVDKNPAPASCDSPVDCRPRDRCRNACSKSKAQFAGSQTELRPRARLQARFVADGCAVSQNPLRSKLVLL